MSAAAARYPPRGFSTDCSGFPTDIERMLLDLGALKESDVRLKKRSDSVDQGRKAEDDDNVEDYDDDWD